MDLTSHFQMLARYNRLANERLFAKCAELDDVVYRKRREVSFGSIHGLLNHILVGDRRWMGLFENADRPPLNENLYDDFFSLRRAREREDTRIEAFFAARDASFWTRTFPNTTRSGIAYTETMHVACSHLFNHQTHHRGQVHAMLSQTPVGPPELDMHRIFHP